APPGVSINPTNGLLTWCPGMASANTTNTVSVRVCDDGTPSLSVTNTFTVAVLPPLSIGSITASNGSATLSWQSISGRTYRVEYKTNLSDSSWTALLPNVTATGPSASRTDSAGAARRFYRLVMY